MIWAIGLLVTTGCREGLRSDVDVPRTVIEDYNYVKGNV